MAFNGLALGGFSMGATDMDVSLDDMIKQVRLFAAPSRNADYLKTRSVGQEKMCEIRFGSDPVCLPVNTPRNPPHRARKRRSKRLLRRRLRKHRCVCPSRLPRRTPECISVRRQITRPHKFLTFKIFGFLAAQVKTPPKQAKRPVKPPPLVTKSAKKKAAGKAVTNRSIDKRAAVLAKKRGLNPSAISAAMTVARKAANARAAPTRKVTKTAPKKGKVRVGKKITIAAVARTARKKPGDKKKAATGSTPKNKTPSKSPAKPFQPKGFATPRSLLISITDFATPPKPKPGSQRTSVLRGKTPGGTGVRKASAAHRQAIGKAAKLAGARSFQFSSLASRLGEARRVKTPTGVGKKKKNKAAVASLEGDTSRVSDNGKVATPGKGNKTPPAAKKGPKKRKERVKRR